MEHGMRNINRLPGGHVPALLAQAHFSRAFHDEVDFLLVLVVPWHLAAVWLEGHMTDAKVGGLDGAGAPDQVLGLAPSGISAPGDLRQVGNDHGGEWISQGIDYNGARERGLGRRLRGNPVGRMVPFRRRAILEIECP